MAASETENLTWVEVAEAAEIPEGEARTFSVDAGRVAVARVRGDLYAVQDLCTHDDGPLGEGRMEGFSVKCPRHGAEFDVRTGEVRKMPAIQPIQTFPVKEDGGKVLVGVTDSFGTPDEDDDW